MGAIFFLVASVSASYRNAAAKAISNGVQLISLYAKRQIELV